MKERQNMASVKGWGNLLPMWMAFSVLSLLVMVYTRKATSFATRVVVT